MVLILNFFFLFLQDEVIELEKVFASKTVLLELQQLLNDREQMQECSDRRNGVPIKNDSREGPKVRKSKIEASLTLKLIN